MIKLTQVVFSAAFIMARYLGFGKWDVSWTGDARVFSCLGYIGAEHMAFDGVKTIGVGRGSIQSAYDLADSLVALGQTTWAERATDRQLLDGQAKASLLLRQHAGNRVVKQDMERLMKVINAEMASRAVISANASMMAKAA